MEQCVLTFWIVNELWHAAILDTRFYSDLQAALRITLDHRPSGASRAETETKSRE